MTVASEQERDRHNNTRLGLIGRAFLVGSWSAQEHAAVPAILLCAGAWQRRAAQGQRTETGGAVQGSGCRRARFRKLSKRADGGRLQRERSGGHPARDRALRRRSG